MRIDEIHSVRLFRGLMIGKPKDGAFEKELEKMTTLLKDSEADLPIINQATQVWTDLFDKDGKYLGYGTWGHLVGAICEMADGDDRYSFMVIFNYIPELDKLDDKLNQAISKIDIKNESFKWDIGDL